MPKATSLPAAAAGTARRMAAWKAARSLQHVIRGQHQHERVVARRSGSAACAASAMAGAVLRPYGLEQDGRRRHAPSRAAARRPGNGGPRCKRPRAPVASGKAREPRRGLLDHGALAGERQELLGQQLARQRPEARAGAAGEDHGDEGHGGGIVPVLVEWVINTRVPCYYLRHEKHHHHPRSETAAWVRVQAAEQNKSVSRLVGEILQEQMKDRREYQRAMQRYLSKPPFDLTVSPRSTRRGRKFMTALVFVDTNVLVYARDPRDAIKRATAARVDSRCSGTSSAAERAFRF